MDTRSGTFCYKFERLYPDTTVALLRLSVRLKVKVCLCVPHRLIVFTSLPGAYFDNSW
jgi:hypothetical protein